VVRRWLLTLAVAIAVIAAAGLVDLWPTGPGPETAHAAAGARPQVVHATIRSVAKHTCEGTVEDRLPDGSIPTEVACPSARVHLTSGPDAGRSTSVDVPAAVTRGGLSAGDRIDLDLYPPTSGQPRTYAWLDFSRTLPLAVIVALFVAVVLLVGRTRGLAALAGLGVAYAGVFFFVVPALVRGEQPVLVALTASVGIMTVILYLAHGFTVKTVAAHLGTTLGLGLTAVLAPLAVHAAHLRGLNGSDSVNLTVLTGQADLSSIVLAGITIAGLGVLNDVTITQASAVWELREAEPTAGFAVLFTRGMHIGRDHLASTVYTLAFAYAGTALPTLVLLYLYAAPAGQVLTSSAIAEELVRTAIGATCLVAAIPFTTAVTAAAVTTATTRHTADPTPTAPAAVPAQHAPPGSPPSARARPHHGRRAAT
jgi:uncharacterized membrane protein